MLICKGGSRAYKDFSSYARSQHCQAGVKGEPGQKPTEFAKEKRERKAPQPKARTGIRRRSWTRKIRPRNAHLEPKPLTHRTSAEEVLQQTNALVLIVNHVRSRFGVNPCGGAIAKPHGICNGKYAEEVSPKLKLQGYFYRERTSSASF